MRLKILCALASLVLGSALANAALVNLGPGSFTPAATTITFSEVPLGTNNPVYNLAAGSLGTVQVSFAGKFLGQTLIGVSPKTLTGTPSNPLTLDTSVRTFTVMDGSNPSSPVLSGDPTFNGPISVKFSVPVAAVGLAGGYFDAVNSTTIEAYDASGNVLGAITNSQTGIEFYGLADSSGQNVISGISFYITGNEPAGFAIDNLTFGAAEVVHDLVPLPAAAWAGIALMSVLGAAKGLRRRQK